MTKRDHWTQPDQLAQIELWVRAGVGESEIAKRIGVRPSVLRGWAEKNAALSDALTRDELCVAVEAALLQRATGYTTTEKRIVEGGRDTTVEKFVPPDVRALIFFLKNRMPHRWKDKEKPGTESPLRVGPDELVQAIQRSAARIWREEGADDEEIQRNP